MADDIKQTFSLDASQTLTTLDKLDASFGKLTSSMTQFVSGLNQFNSASSSADSAGAKLGNTFKTTVANGAASAQASTERLTVSLGLLSRVVITQQIVSGLRIIKSELSSTASEALSFQKGLSEIQTIVPGASLDELGKKTRELSDQFNIPIGQVVKSQYDLASIGFQNATDQANVLTAAFKLSKTAISSGDDAINLISTSLRAFGQSSEQAESLGARFFKTVELGKIVGTELAANISKVAPAFNTLGLSINEALASFSTLTVRGVSAAEAATQINALATAFTKPTEALTKQAQALGFASGTALIAEKGLVGGTNLLIQSVNAAPEAVARMISNIRGIRGGLGLADQGFTTFQDHLQKISSFTPQDHNSVYFTRISNDAERVTSDLNKLNNAMIDGVGGALVKSAAEFSRWIGGVENATSVIDVSGKALLGLERVFKCMFCVPGGVT